MSVIAIAIRRLSQIAGLFRRSIKYKLLLAFLVTIAIPTLLSDIISFQMSSAVVQKDFMNNKSRLIESVSRLLDENTNTLVRQSLSIYNDPDDILFILNARAEDSYTEYLSSYTRISNYFQSVMQSNDKIDSIALFSVSGEVKYYANKQGGNTNFENVRNKSWFLNTLAQKGNPLIAVPYRNDYVQDDRIRETPLLSVSRGVLDLDSGKNTLRGVLSIEQDLQQFERLLSNAISEQNEVLTVLNASNNVIYTNEPIAADLRAKLIAQVLVHSETDERSFRFDADVRPMLATFYISPEYDWKVISLLPIAELDKKSQFLKNINLTLMIILGLLAFMIAFTFSHLVTKPLSKLMLSFRKFQRGDFETRIRVKGTDELSSIGLTFNKMVEEMKLLIEQKYEMTIVRNQAELKALQHQINPHFLYNTLTSIKAVIDKQDHGTASVMVQHLADIFRYHLSAREHVVTFRDELAYIRKYLFIQECRYADKLEIYYDIDDEVLVCGILRLTLQPIVENALVHGLEPKIGKGEVRIVAKYFNNDYYIYITDNGAGIPPDKLARLNAMLERGPEWNGDADQERVGIYNVNARIKYYYGMAYGLRISSEPGGPTTVKITLPAERRTNDDHSDR